MNTAVRDDYIFHRADRVLRASILAHTCQVNINYSGDLRRPGPSHIRHVGGRRGATRPRDDRALLAACGGDGCRLLAATPALDVIHNRLATTAVIGVRKRHVSCPERELFFPRSFRSKS